MSKMQFRSLLYCTGLVLAILCLCLTSCTYEENTKVSVDGGIPPTFKLSGSGHQMYFVVSEIPPENQVRVADRDSSKNIRLWKILPKEGDANIAWNWPPITYGKVPAGFFQEIPAQGMPPDLIEGESMRQAALRLAQMAAKYGL